MTPIGVSQRTCATKPPASRLPASGAEILPRRTRMKSAPEKGWPSTVLSPLMRIGRVPISESSLALSVILPSDSLPFKVASPTSKLLVIGSRPAENPSADSLMSLVKPSRRWASLRHSIARIQTPASAAAPKVNLNHFSALTGGAAAT